jgi:hypothetical protein
MMLLQKANLSLRIPKMRDNASQTGEGRTKEENKMIKRNKMEESK